MAKNSDAANIKRRHMETSRDIASGFAYRDEYEEELESEETRLVEVTDIPEDEMPESPVSLARQELSEEDQKLFARVQNEMVFDSPEEYEAFKLARYKYYTALSDILKDEIGTLDELPVVYGDVACMLYTSGTTGVPKGVKVTRKSILNVAAVYCDKFGFGSDDVYGLFANIGFDAGSWAVCQTIYAGACLSIVPDDIKLDVHELNNYFINQGVNHCMITTQVGKLFMENIEDTSLEV